MTAPERPRREVIEMVELKIDPEFESLIPPLTNEEFKQLRDNIIEDGEVREPIVTWNGVILDGYNRWAVIQENPDIPFKTMEMIFFSRDEAKVWMIRNQLGRRNLPDYERAKLALRLKEAIAADAKKNVLATQKNNAASAYQKSDRQIHTNKELAKIAGVSHDTISRVETIEAKATPEVKEQLRKGEISINKVYNEIRQADQMKETPKSPPNKPEYTIKNLVDEIGASSENYIRFLKQTLANRSTVYAETENRKKIHDLVSTIKQRIEEIENLIG